MKSMSRMEKLNVAVGATSVMIVVSAIGLASSWFGWQTFFWGLGLCGSLLGWSYVVKLGRKEVTA